MAHIKPKTEETVEVRVEDVLSMHKDACNSWKKRIEKTIPQLFNQSIPGKWMVNTSHVNTFVYFPDDCTEKLTFALLDPAEYPKENSVGEMILMTYNYKNTRAELYKDVTDCEVVERLIKILSKAKIFKNERRA